MAKSLHPNTVVKIKNKSFVFVWHELLIWSRCHAVCSKPSVWNWASTQMKWPYLANYQVGTRVDWFKSCDLKVQIGLKWMLHITSSKYVGCWLWK